MRYGRKQRKTQKTERPFARRFKYESTKEGLGKLLEWGGAGVGMFMGLAAERLGLPIPSSVATTGGAIIGGLIDSQGKALVVTRLDLLREQRDRRQTAKSATSAAASGDRETADRTDHDRPAIPPNHAGAATRGSVRIPHRRRLTSRPASASVASQVISGLEKVIEQIDRASQQLNQVGVDVWGSHNSVMAILAGGRPDVVRRTHDRMSAARLHVQESAGLLRQASENLCEYRSGI